MPRSASIFLAFSYLLLPSSEAFCDPNDGQRVPLWNGRAPVGNDKFEEAEVWLTVHTPAKSNGAAVVVCPGGGYRGLVTGPEGHGIAKWLNQHGVTGAVLEYRLPQGRPFVPLLDAQRAIRLVRAQGRQWSVEPSKIGIMGFSAGGHLASTAATHFDEGDPEAQDEVQRSSCRPDFAILIYPVITMDNRTHAGSKKNLLGPEPSSKLVDLFSNEKQVTAKTCPTFRTHALDDKPVPIENSRLFYKALQTHGVSTRLLELPSGGHGLNGYKGPMWDAWQQQSLAWLTKQNFLPAP